jgi:hypothetical protein
MLEGAGLSCLELLVPRTIMNPWGRCCGLAWCALAWLGAVASAAGQEGPRKARVPAELQEKIHQAIANGRDYLKRVQAGGTWERGADTPGATALAAWTLLECGVPRDDPVVRRAADALRKWAVAERKHYHISLMIFFFNKLADPEDAPLVESLAYRLLVSQNPEGAWSYFSEEVPAAEQQRLQRVINQRKGNGPPLRLQTNPRTFGQLDPAIQRLIQRLPDRQLRPGHAANQQGGDHSNTQLAMLALWVAQSYGIPARQALLRTANRFLQAQLPSGGWAYENRKDSIRPFHSPAMTCAGLLGLTLGHANTPAGQGAHAKEALLGSTRFQAGLRHLGRILRGKVATGPGDGGKIYYFLWSLERLGVVCDLDRIDGIDWYADGARKLVSWQEANGSWQGGEFAVGGCDTCFALLFLTRANVADDLRLQLQLGLDKANIVTVPKARDEPAFDLGTGFTEEKPKKDLPRSKSGAGRQALLAPAPVEGEAIVERARNDESSPDSSFRARSIPSQPRSLLQ